MPFRPARVRTYVRMLTTNQKGAIAEQAIMLAAVRLDLPVYRPVHEHGRMDLVLEAAGRLWGVQCNWASLSEDRTHVVAGLRTSRRGPSGHVHRTYTASEIDLFALYCGELDRCFLLPISLFEGVGLVHLRLTPARNGQVACTNLADDFDFVGAIAQLGERVTGSHEVAGSSPASSISSGPFTAVGSNPFRNRLGYWMERVAGGDEILVTFRGKPRVRLVPATGRTTASPSPLAERSPPTE
jgi:prevent-host-death family protein